MREGGAKEMYREGEREMACGRGLEKRDARRAAGGRTRGSSQEVPLTRTKFSFVRPSWGSATSEKRDLRRREERGMERLDLPVETGKREGREKEGSGGVVEEQEERG